MNDYLVECVPNISEGRDLKKVDEILKNISKHGIKILHTDIGYDANRTVITIVGAISEMIKAVKELYKSAVHLIDMSLHEGKHPRIGAVDVCPFIPFEIKDQNDLMSRVSTLAKEISQEHSIPIFLYAKSSKGNVAKSLPKIRKGEYEKLISSPMKMNYMADYGKNYIDQSFGGSVMGVRDFMVAYNINISTADLSIAKQIAAEMRDVRKKQGHHQGKNIRPLQILGWFIEEYQCCQISTNIHNPRELSMVDVFRFAQSVCEKYDINAVSSELIGMLPEFALDACLEGDHTEQELIKQLGFDFKDDFRWEEKVLERKMEEQDYL